MSMVHDNIIKSYLVDIENKQLKLFTTYHYNNSHYEETTVIFEAYLTHSFKHIDSLSGNIIFDINDYPIEIFIKNNIDAINDGKGHGWPVFYDSINDIKIKLEEQGLKTFEIGSSLGLYGWVIAKEMIIDVKEIIEESENV